MSPGEIAPKCRAPLASIPVCFRLKKGSSVELLWRFFQCRKSNCMRKTNVCFSKLYVSLSELSKKPTKTTMRLLVFQIFNQWHCGYVHGTHFWYKYQAIYRSNDRGEAAMFCNKKKFMRENTENYCWHFDRIRFQTETSKIQWYCQAQTICCVKHSWKRNTTQVWLTLSSGDGTFIYTNVAMEWNFNDFVHILQWFLWFLIAWKLSMYVCLCVCISNRLTCFGHLKTLFEYNFSMFFRLKFTNARFVSIKWRRLSSFSDRFIKRKKIQYFNWFQTIFYKLNCECHLLTPLGRESAVLLYRRMTFHICEANTFDTYDNRLNSQWDYLMEWSKASAKHLSILI